MRVICDAPGQTCNRLWSYVASVAQCIAEHKKMVIIFYDWTIEDFPNLLHAPFIHFPLWQPWFLRLPRGWGWYKHLTWKVTHNKIWDIIFKFLGLTKGWNTRTDTRYLQQTLPELKRIFRPKDEIINKAEDGDRFSVYLGLTYLKDNDYGNIIYDWRSPICSLFYDFEVLKYVLQ